MESMVSSPWPWYVAGPLIGLMVPALLLFDNRQFGISSTLRDFCAVVRPGKLEYFNYSVKEQLWRNWLVLGVLIGGWLASQLWEPVQVGISQQTIQDLSALGITNFSGYVPSELFNWKELFGLHGLVFVFTGGFMIGFGTRWADGCTAGHAITGLSLLSPASLLAVVGFFIGGLFTTHFLLPILLT